MSERAAAELAQAPGPQRLLQAFVPDAHIIGFYLPGGFVPVTGYEEGIDPLVGMEFVYPQLDSWHALESPPGREAGEPCTYQERKNSSSNGQDWRAAR